MLTKCRNCGINTDYNVCRICGYIQSPSNLDESIKNLLMSVLGCVTESNGDKKIQYVKIKQADFDVFRKFARRENNIIFKCICGCTIFRVRGNLHICNDCNRQFEGIK